MKFSEKVLGIVKQIPKGKVSTYGIVARKLGTSPRAVGQALKRNRYPNKTDCFRVICSNGNLGGYSLGQEEKIKRLKKEGVLVKNKKIDLEKYLWR